MISTGSILWEFNFARGLSFAGGIPTIIEPPAMKEKPPAGPAAKKKGTLTNGIVRFLYPSFVPVICAQPRL